MKYKQKLPVLTGILFSLAATLIVTGQAAEGADLNSQNKAHLSDYIRPLVGTRGQGNTFPGAAAPFGMVQFSPDTSERSCGGYRYIQGSILGFSLTHLSGTGIPDLGDFLFTPQIGEVRLTPGSRLDPNSGYRSWYSHDDEVASAGYYRVKLANGVTVELTAGERAGLMRLTFPASTNASIMIDLNHVLERRPGHVIWSELSVQDDSTVTGFHLVHGWAPDRRLYFAARYSRPFNRFQIMRNGRQVKYDSFRTYRFRSSREASGTNMQFVAEYQTHADEVVLVKIGVSAVSAANALENLNAEIPAWNFDRVRNETRAAWDRELSRIQVEGSSDVKETFYTSVYHAFLTPNLYEDVNGQYRGLDKGIHEAKGFTNYTIFSLWDTFRAEHPLFTLIQAKRDSDMINTLLDHFDESVDHLLPIWELQANETWCMIGYHAVPVIVDGYFRGVKGFDAERAYNAIKTTAMNPDYDSVATYAKLGWVPFDKENESVSKTLEYAYDDYCIARMAKALGKKDDYNYFMKRANSFKNIFDPSVGFMRGRDSQGNWRTPFNPRRDRGGTRGDITEGNSWQYSWFVPQDVPALIKLEGGREAFLKKLDEFFGAPYSPTNRVGRDGNIGEYWHGNEPSHHIIYLYCYAGEPWKAAERLHEIVSQVYGNKPDSLCGNDDCGQMSAWYLFTCMGFYPVCPASDYYVIGAPQVRQVVLHLSNGNQFTMKAENISDQNIYVQSVKLDGKDWNNPFLPCRDVQKGGELLFVMGPHPSQWGTDPGMPPTD